MSSCLILHSFLLLFHNLVLKASLHQHSRRYRLFDLIQFVRKWMVLMGNIVTGLTTNQIPLRSEVIILTIPAGFDRGFL